MSKTKYIREFKNRENNQNRIEALSDGVFALAIAISLLSANSPANYQELKAFVLDLIPFGLSCIFIFWIWKEQKNYFHRFGLYDRKSTHLNLFLLFFVISYAFPLKFLMSWLIGFFGSIFTGNIRADYEYFNAIIPLTKMNSVMIIYGLGYILVFGCLYLMYRYALSKKEEIGLSKTEIIETNHIKQSFFISSSIGVLSVCIALIGRHFESYTLCPFFAGSAYNLVWITEIFRNKKRVKALEELESE